jgi:urease beta subunit
MKYQIGEIILKDDPIIINEGKETVEIFVTNNGDRCIQVCSHYHFFETNFALAFDREKAFGKRLDIPSGTAVRFEPGEEKKISLVPFAGDKKVIGFKGLTMGDVTDPVVKKAALSKMEQLLKGGGK